jgi:hypothetical protein
MVFRLCTYFVLCFFMACKSPSAGLPITPPIEGNNLYNQHAVDSAISLLKTGDVVLRAGTGPFSYMLATANQRDKSYSHCGIVVIENGYPFVYHSIGGEDNADERLRRDSIPFFLSPTRNLGIAIVRYDLVDSQVKSFARIAQTFYHSRPLFDPKFDLLTDDELYCSEFVYKAITRAVNDTGYIAKSYGYGRVYIGIDDLYLNPHATIVYKVNYR